MMVILASGHALRLAARAVVVTIVMGLSGLVGACAGKPVPVVSAPSLFQNVGVHTPGVTGADCIMEAGRRNYRVQSPGNVQVEKSFSPMTVSCYKGAYLRGVARVTPTYAPRERQERENSAANAGPLPACVTCSYPNTVTVAMGIDPRAFERDVRILR